jgi:hypothetical protein
MGCPLMSTLPTRDLLRAGNRQPKLFLMRLIELSVSTLSINSVSGSIIQKKSLISPRRYGNNIFSGFTSAKIRKKILLIAFAA